MKMVWTRAALAAALTLTLAGCSGGTSKSDSDSGASSAPPPATTPVATATLPTGLDDGPRAADDPANAARVEQGEKLFSTKGCTACHSFGKKLTGPDLAGVTQRRTAKWIENQILHPDLMTKNDPIAKELYAKFMLQMPKQGLTPDEALAVIEYFKHHDRDGGKAHEKKEGE